MTIRPLRSVLLVAALVAGARAASAAEAPTKKHRDPAHKFSFKVFDDFEPVPIESSDPHEACKFVQSGDRGWGMTPARLTVYRLATGAAAGPVLTGEDVPRPPLRGDPGGPGDPKDAVALINQRLSNAGLKGRVRAKEAKAIESKDDVPGRLWAVETDHEIPEYGKFFLTCAAWKKGDVEIAMVMACMASQRKKYENGFRGVAKSFSWFDAKAKDVETLEVLDGLNITPKKRREIERGLVKGWDVVVSPKKNYIVVYNTMGKRNDLLAKTIAKNIEQIREQIYETQFPPAQKIDVVCVCRVCGNQAEYHAYGGPPGSAGYWNPMAEELVFYDASPSKKIDDETVAVLYHEAFHQYIHFSAGRMAPHSWFNEGHGDYYAGAKQKGGKYRIEPFVWRIGIVKNAIRMGPCPFEVEKGPGGAERRAWDRSSRGYSPLRELLTMDQGEYYSYAGVHYAQGWSLIYFLREIVPKNAKWQAKWGRILPVYFDTLKAEVAKSRGVEITPPSDPKDPGPAPGGPDGGGNGDPAKDGGGKGKPPKDDDEGGGPVDPGDVEDNPEDAMGVPRFEGSSDEGALKKALDAAFRGVDLAELEKAWAESILKVNG